MIIVISTVVSLFIASICRDNPTLAIAEAQNDPKLTSIKERISKTTPQGKQIIERALGTKVETFAGLTEQSLNDLIRTQVAPDNQIGWEALPKEASRWRIILHYQNPNHIQRYFDAEWEYNPKTGKLLAFEPNNPIFRSTSRYTKSYRYKTRRVKVVEESFPFAIRGSTSESWLFTTVGRHKYFIDYIRWNGAGTLSEAFVDPTCTYIAYESGTGCGYEGDGKTAFISDVYGKNRYPILGGGPQEFLEYKGKLYLLLADGDEASYEDNAFCLYDVSAKEFVMCAKGDITQIRKGVFSYGYYPRGDKIKPVGTVTMKNLVNRERPLLLLPTSTPGVVRHPTYRLTRRKNTRMFLSSGDNECCWCCQTDKHAVIPKARTRVLILGTCDEDGYQVYYNREMGKVRKRDLKSIN